jgi:hypothetical protein
VLKITTRLKALATGLAITLYGTAMTWRGKFEYHNFYSMTLYSPAVIATGVLIFLLCLPPASWVDWIVRRRTNRSGESCGHPDDSKRLELR